MEYPARKLHRLEAYDYGRYGYYYVTLCTHKKRHCLSSVVGNDALVVPSTVGEMVRECWENIALCNENVALGPFVFMPNHIHGIIILENLEGVEPIERKYGFETAERRGRRSLPGLMKDFKSVTARKYQRLTGDNVPLWQKSYYDEVIRSDSAYREICCYIDQNPAKWAEDPYHCETGGIL